MSSEPHRKIFQCRGAESGMAPVPLDSSGERDFLRERIGFYALATFVASVAFFAAGFVIEGFWPPQVGGPARLTRPDILFHLAAGAVLFLMWVATRQPGLTASTLHFVDGAGTIAAFALYACMAGSMPAAWKPEQLFMLIVMAVLLYRAAIVPSVPLRTAWISALSAAPAPIMAAVMYSKTSPPEVSRGQSVAYAILWALLAISLSILLSFVTFRLRKTVARARKLGQYTLGEKLGEGGMGIVYRAEHEMLRRPTAIKLLPPGRAGEDSLKRFEREVQQTARLTNPHTVSIYDYGRTPDGLFYYVMEYLDGIDLEDLVRGERAHAARPRGAHPAAGLRGARRGPRHRPHPPGHQAGQHHSLRARRHPRHRQGPGFRPRAGDHRVRRSAPDRGKRRARHAAVPGSRGDSQRRLDRRPKRSLRSRRGRVLPADRHARLFGARLARGDPSPSADARPSRLRNGSASRSRPSSRR